jgi:hypothetical protein
MAMHLSLAVLASLDTLVPLKEFVEMAADGAACSELKIAGGSSEKFCCDRESRKPDFSVVFGTGALRLWTLWSEYIQKH